MKTYPTDSNLEGVVLAAGLSRRAGSSKPCLLLAGKPLLRHAVDGLRVICRRVIVVVGHEHERVAALVTGIAGVVTVINPRYRDDMFYSVQVGVDAVSPDAAGIVVQPVDCPLVPATVYQTLAQAFTEEDGRLAIVPEYAGRGGHPVVLPSAARSPILAGGPPSTLRTILDRVGVRRVTVDSSAIHLDIDSPADLAAAAGTVDIDPRVPGDLS